MNWRTEWKKLALMAGAFLVCFHLPVGTPRFDHAVMESLRLVKWYAREHVLFCLVPAFFIAGAISVFVSQASVLKYLGPRANKVVAYGVASVSGGILAVCSCTVLPLFAGIYRMGAGLGPATTFLYSGPAINVLAIALTARVLGLQLGVARAVGAVAFSVVVGLLMHLLFRKEEEAKAASQLLEPQSGVRRPLWQNALFLLSLVAILVFANWGRPAGDHGLLHAISTHRWKITSLFAVCLGVTLVAWFNVRWYRLLPAAIPAVVLAFFFPSRPTLAFVAAVVGLSLTISTDRGEAGEWFASSWALATQIFPLLLAGVMVAGLLLGSPEGSGGGMIPSQWVLALVGGNSLGANVFASVVGAFMYFATLTEVPILKGLIANGMGQGPALALLLAGPALSLPSMLVIRSIMGTKKAAVFVCLVVLMATATGILFGAWAA